MNRQWIFRYNPEGPVTEDVFEWTQAPEPDMIDGQVLVRNRMLSLDPANRAWMRGPTYRPQVMPGDVMHGFTIGEVVKSHVAGFPPGTIVEAMGGWQDYALLAPEELTIRPADLPLDHLIGAYSITGLTSYIGIFDIGRPRAGDTVLVSAAAGAVGSLAGQLARIAGARVVGIAGGSEKCAWLKDELGFDAVVDYKAPDMRKAIRAACPDGVDIFFDNVGGEVLDGALRAMNEGGRIVCCGAVASYDAKGKSYVSPLLPGVLVTKRLRMQGFIVLDHMDRRVVAERRLRHWIETGLLRAATDVESGLERAPKALIKLLAGGNRGKMAVTI